MDALISLNHARETAMPWRTLAKRLHALETSAPLAPDGQPWIRAAEAASGGEHHAREELRELVGRVERQHVRDVLVGAHHHDDAVA